MRTHFCPASYIVKVKQGAKTCRYTQTRLRGQLFHKQFSGLQIATLAFQHLLLSESLPVPSALLRVYLCRFLQAMHGRNVLYNVATALLSSFVIPDLLCGFSQLNLCDIIIFIPDTQPPSAPALVIFNSSGLCRQIVRKGQWRRALKSSEPLFFAYFRLDYYECVLFFV